MMGFFFGLKIIFLIFNKVKTTSKKKEKELSEKSVSIA